MECLAAPLVFCAVFRYLENSFTIGLRYRCLPTLEVDEGTQWFPVSTFELLRGRQPSAGAACLPCWHDVRLVKK